MSSSNNKIVHATSLTKSYKGETVVNGINFEVSPGKCFGLLGPNGAGKTTTLRMILGLSPADSGVLKVFDLVMPEYARQVRKKIGVVPQTDNLDPDFTVSENLSIYGSYFRIDADILNKRIKDLLIFAGLQDRADTKIGALSGGMQRRLTIARALVNDPDLVVLDEPTTGLDPQARHMIWGRLRELMQNGKTLVLTTHYMEEAERLCDELIVMERGKIIIGGSPKNLIKTNVEAEVVEVRSGGKQAVESLKNLNGYRFEKAGDTYYFYTNNASQLTAELEKIHDIVFLHRPANLEDVFLKLTGRELVD
jgi:lipooligosaccharide transport system ATP-binding protein